ncbi:hypothetical protein [Geminicoccus flavidas]|uniref:hypothetical protein n=1 Tax=Geminicoccus flavidas TaxID=2506407 RepID=UPI00135AECF0|nr:hypothetical protein [Geminicoccus flavidas]
MPKQTSNLTVVAEEATGAEQAVAAVQAEIQAQEQRLANLKARLVWEQGRAEREAAQIWRQGERQRLARLAELVDARVQAAAAVEQAMQVLANVIAAYQEAEKPVRALLDLSRERDKNIALQAGEGRLGRRLNGMLRQIGITELPYHREDGPLQDAERAALAWPSTVDEPIEDEAAAA